MLAVLAGVGTFIATNAVLGGLHAFACGASQAMYAMLRLSVFALPVRVVCWFVAAWIGWTVFDSVSG